MKATQIGGLFQLLTGERCEAVLWKPAPDDLWHVLLELEFENTRGHFGDDLLKALRGELSLECLFVSPPPVNGGPNQLWAECGSRGVLVGRWLVNEKTPVTRDVVGVLTERLNYPEPPSRGGANERQKAIEPRTAG